MFLHIVINSSKVSNFHGLIFPYQDYPFRHFCFLDCAARYSSGISDIPELEKQAEGNLRRSFAVVGLLDDIDTFFEMLNDRFSYLDPSLVNETGSRHETLIDLKEKCEQFKNPLFQNLLKAASPAISAISRLYEVAVEVNRFQIEELSKCKDDSSIF